MTGTAECPVCGGAAAEFLCRGSVPVHQNRAAESRAAARAAPRGRMQMHVCGRCGFVFNAAFDRELVDYGPGYDGCQELSPAFRHHLDDMLSRLGPPAAGGGRIVEIGCGSGEFLRRAVRRAGPRWTGVGFDPAAGGGEADADGQVRVVRSVYDEQAAGCPADIVICRHVIEHLADPVALLRLVRRAVAPGGRVFFETPCVQAILRNAWIWDIFYEHCSLFSAGSLAAAFARAGFAVDSVANVFGGQYLWIEARLGAGEAALPEAAACRGPGAVADLAAAWAGCERRRVAEWAASLTTRPAVWGAAAKGSTFCNLLDPAGRRIVAVADVNPAKQGRFIAGTGHPIVSPAELAAAAPDSVVVPNPNYAAEIRGECARLGLGVPVVAAESEGL